MKNVKHKTDLEKDQDSEELAEENLLQNQQGNDSLRLKVHEIFKNL